MKGSNKRIHEYFKNKESDFTEFLFITLDVNFSFTELFSNKGRILFKIIPRNVKQTEYSNEPTVALLNIFK